MEWWNIQLTLGICDDLMNSQLSKMIQLWITFQLNKMLLQTALVEISDFESKIKHFVNTWFESGSQNI